MLELFRGCTIENLSEIYSYTNETSNSEINDNSNDNSNDNFNDNFNNNSNDNSSDNSNGNSSDNSENKRHNVSIILTLSDLHFKPDYDEENELHLLIKDLKQVYFKNHLDTFTLEDIQFIVISGDFVEYSDLTSFKKAFNFIYKLCLKCKIVIENDKGQRTKDEMSKRLLIVPGNHDLSWETTRNAFCLLSTQDFKIDQKVPSDELDSLGNNIIHHITKNDKLVCTVGSDVFFLARDESIWNERFELFNSQIYRPIYGEDLTYDLIDGKPASPYNKIKVVTGEIFQSKKIAFFFNKYSLRY